MILLKARTWHLRDRSYLNPVGTLLATAACVLLSLFLSVSGSDGMSDARSTVHPESGKADPPDPAVQAFLKNLLSLDERRMIDGDEEWLREKLDELEGLVERDHVRLVAELLYFSAHAADMKEGMLPAALIEQLGITTRELALAVLPCLASPDAKLKDAAFDALGLIESDPDTDARSFVVYKGLLQDLGFEGTAPFVRRMYERDPELAIRTIAEVVKGGSAAAQLVERDVSRAPATLRSLATRPEWWIRLYVASVLLLEPQLEPTLRDRLRSDPNPMVREFAEKASGVQAR